MTKPKERDNVAKYQVYRRVSFYLVFSKCAPSDVPHSLFRSISSRWPTSRISRLLATPVFCGRGFVAKSTIPTRLVSVPPRVQKRRLTLVQCTHVPSIITVDWVVSGLSTLNLHRRGTSGNRSWRKPSASGKLYRSRTRCSKLRPSALTRSLSPLSCLARRPSRGVMRTRTRARLLARYHSVRSLRSD